MKLYKTVATTLWVLGVWTSASAQLTWDTLPGTAGPGDSVVEHADGTWDTTAANWTPDGGVNNQAWVNGSDVVFTTNAAKSSIQVDLGSGITVGDLTIQSAGNSGEIQLYPLVDGETLTVQTGGATWDLGKRTLRLGNNQSNDLNVVVGSGDTLTIVSTGGGGLLDTGENPNTGTWIGTGAILDFQAGKLAGDALTVGQFDQIKMIGGSIYIHERNTDKTYANDWDLGSGAVTFENKYARKMTLAGVVSGPGTLVTRDLNKKPVVLKGVNTFSGGVVINGTNTYTQLNVDNDGQLGAVPGSFDADHITLMNGGALQLSSVALNANRGITLDHGGSLVLTSGASSYGGKISGTGELSIGNANSTSGNALTLTSSSHDLDGDVRIYRGTITLGIDNALPTNSVVNIGGGGSSILEMNGFDQTIVSLKSSGSNTRKILNNGASTSILTIHSGASYGANVDGPSKIFLIKKGLGTQRFNRNGFGNPFEGATVNEGRLRFDYPAGIDPANLTVNAGAEFVINTPTVGLTDGWVAADISALLSTATFNAGSFLVFHGENGDFSYPNVISGGVGLGHSRTNDLTLTAANTYTGGTYIENNSSITLSGSGSINDSSFIDLRGSDAVFDVTAKDGFVLAAHQALTGFGIVTGAVSTSVSSVLSPGGTDGLGELVFSSDLDISALAGANTGGVVYDFGTNGFDQIKVDGTFSASSLGMADFTFSDMDAMGSGIYILFDAAALSVTLDLLDLTGSVGGNSAQGTLSISGTDVILTVTGASDYSAFGQWVAVYELSGGDAQEEADPDADDYSNLEEFAYGGNPTNAADAGYIPASGQRTQGGTNYFEYTYTYNTNANYGVTYRFGTRPNLVFGEWTNIYHEVLGSEDQGDGFLTLTNGVPLDGTDQHFFRLLLEKQP